MYIGLGFFIVIVVLRIVKFSVLNYTLNFQVSHHPPMYAMHVEHKDWTVWEEYTVSSRFRGKYVACTPIGCTHVVFHHTGHHYTYNRPLITVHNIIVGKLWVDQVSPRMYIHT